MSQALSTRSPSVAWTIRDVRGADELRACQDLQRLAWGISEDGYVVPVATMAGAQKVGGLVLGAFMAADGADEPGTEKLVGFTFAFQGAWRGQRILYSQLTGVHPAYQSSGVGRRLKGEQWQRARASGLDAVVWAFDPLQASNASFNLVTLGAVARTYEVDLYGSRSDSLNAGLQTDRLMAEWPTSPPLEKPQTRAWTDTFNLLRTRASASTAHQVVADVAPIPADARHLAIEVPASIGTLKAALGNDAAKEWQSAVRVAFQRAFERGFTAVGFCREHAGQPRYLLERTR